jgi:hypothetical protein
MATVFNAPVTAIGIKDLLGICLLWGWTDCASNQFEKIIFRILFARSRLLTIENNQLIWLILLVGNLFDTTIFFHIAFFSAEKHNIALYSGGKYSLSAILIACLLGTTLALKPFFNYEDYLAYLELMSAVGL